MGTLNQALVGPVWGMWANLHDSEMIVREKLGFWLMQLNEAASFCTSWFIGFICFFTMLAVCPAWTRACFSIYHTPRVSTGLGDILPCLLEVQLLLEDQEAPADRVGGGLFIAAQIMRGKMECRMRCSMLTWAPGFPCCPGGPGSPCGP